MFSINVAIWGFNPDIDRQTHFCILDAKVLKLPLVVVLAFMFVATSAGDKTRQSVYAFHQISSMFLSDTRKQGIFERCFSDSLPLAVESDLTHHRRSEEQLRFARPL